MRTQKEIESLNDNKTETHTVRLKNLLYKRVMRYCYSVNKKGGDEALREVITDALIKFIDEKEGI